MDYKNHCRTCLEQSKEMRHVKTTITISGTDVRLSDILKSFYNYEVIEEAWYPENICINCVHHLTLTHAFKLLLESSAKKLAMKALENVSENNDDYDLDRDYKPEEDIKPKNKKIIKFGNIKHVRRQKPLIIKRNSELQRQLFCVECKAEFRGNKSLMDHCTNNHTVKSITGRDCGYCPEKFEDFKELVKHRKLHLKPFLCLTCWGGFYKETDYIMHKCQPQPIRTHNPKILRQCDQCGKSYPQGYIRVHMMTHGDDRRYSCKYCPKKFKVANCLNSHVLWAHKRTRDFKCEVCDAAFISASARSTHIRKNHLKEKKYGCENCAKRFFSKSELQRHMLTHTGVKDFHCHLCDKSYQTRYGLNVHLKSHSHMTLYVGM